MNTLKSVIKTPQQRVMETALDIAFACGSSDWSNGTSADDHKAFVDWAEIVQAGRRIDAEGKVTFGGMDYYGSMWRVISDKQAEKNHNANIITVPPDPEGENDSRAQWASVALEAFKEETGTGEEDVVSDLICDLHHWCDRNNLNFQRQLGRAKQNYEDETYEDENNE